MEGTVKQKKKLGIIIAVAIAIIVVGVVILFALKANKSSSQKETKETNEYEIVKPGKDTLDVSKIQGYSAKVGDSDKKDDSKETEKQSKSFFPIRTSRLSPSVLIPVLL